MPQALQPSQLRGKANEQLERAKAFRAEIDSGDLSEEEMGAKVAEMGEAVAEHRRLIDECLEKEALQQTLDDVEALEMPPIPSVRDLVKGASASATISDPTRLPSVPAAPRDRVEEGKAGFGHFGEFAIAVMNASIPATAATPDSRLAALHELRPSAQAGMSQGVGSDGGFVIPETFSTQIWDGLNQLPDNLLARTDQIPVSGQSVTIPANAETSRATGSRYGGVQGYWIAEAATITESFPKLRKLKLEPQELAVLVPATDKSLRNSAGALETYLRRASIDEINFLVGDAIVNGSGAGQPLGIMNSGGLISVAKEASQAADTFNQENVAKMWSRLHQRARASAVWLTNQDVDPQLLLMVTNVKNVAATDNVGGFNASLYDPASDTLMGRPVIRVEYCATIGDTGDVILVDLSSYATGIPTARNSIDVASSIHLYFSTAQTAFRFMFEVDGQPYLNTALTPFKGSNTLSTHVKLDARA